MGIALSRDICELSGALIIYIIIKRDSRFDLTFLRIKKVLFNNYLNI